MLFAGSGSVHMVKNCDIGAENARAAFLTRELRACAKRVIDTMWGMAFARSLARSLDWSIPVNFFKILGFWVHFIVFGEQ